MLQDVPAELMQLVLDVSGRAPTRCLSLVSHELKNCSSAHVLGHALDAFLVALVELMDAYADKEERGADYDAEWITEWDAVPVGRVVGWLRSLPTSFAFMPVGDDTYRSAGDRNVDVYGPVEELITFWECDAKWPAASGDWVDIVSYEAPLHTRLEANEAIELIYSALKSLSVRKLEEAATLMHRLAARVRAMPPFP